MKIKEIVTQSGPRLHRHLHTIYLSSVGNQIAPCFHLGHTQKRITWRPFTGFQNRSTAACHNQRGSSNLIQCLMWVAVPTKFQLASVCNPSLRSLGRFVSHSVSHDCIYWRYSHLQQLELLAQLLWNFRYTNLIDQLQISRLATFHFLSRRSNNQ